MFCKHGRWLRFGVNNYGGWGTITCVCCGNTYGISSGGEPMTGTCATCNENYLKKEKK